MNRWKDKYRLSDASDRRTRRYMEKENKAYQDRARYEYNNTGSQSASFAKRRDTRFKELQKIAAERREINEIEQKAAVKREKEKRRRERLKKGQGKRKGQRWRRIHEGCSVWRG